MLTQSNNQFYSLMNQKLTSLISVCAALILFNPATLVAQTPDYGTARRPRTCPSRANPITGKLTIEQAKIYFICDYEVDTPILHLVNDVNLQISSRSRPANNFSDFRIKGALNMNVKKGVYDIRGSFTSYTCFNATPGREGKNCDIAYLSGTGICFNNTSDEWHCRMLSAPVKEGERNVPPPTNMN